MTFIEKKRTRKEIKPNRDFSLIHYNARYFTRLYDYIKTMSMPQAVMLDYLVNAHHLLNERYTNEDLRESFVDDGDFYKDDDWFMCPSETVRNDLNITLGQEQRLLTYLRKRKLIKTRRFGMPGVRYAKVMFDKINKLLKTD